MKRLIVVAALFCMACGSFEEMKSVRRDTERAADTLEKDLGTRPEIGFNIFNGNLAVINVVIDSAQVQRLKVYELEGRVHRVLASTLSQKPQQILISLRASAFNTGHAAELRLEPGPASNVP